MGEQIVWVSALSWHKRKDYKTLMVCPSSVIPNQMLPYVL